MLAATTWQGLARGFQMARSRQQRRPDRSCKRHPREALAHGLRGGKDMVGRRVHPTLAHGSVVHGAGPSHGPNGDWHNVHSFSAVVRRGQRYSFMLAPKEVSRPVLSVKIPSYTKAARRMRRSGTAAFRDPLSLVPVGFHCQSAR